jgi:hypothetical protein
MAGDLAYHDPEVGNAYGPAVAPFPDYQDFAGIKNRSAQSWQNMKAMRDGMMTAGFTAPEPPASAASAGIRE